MNRATEPAQTDLLPDDPAAPAADPAAEPPKEPAKEPPPEPAAKEPAPAAEPKEPVAPKWPENWREQLAGEDSGTLNKLKRYGTPEDYFRSARALELKLQSGEYTKALPDDPTEDEIKEYRELRGIPEKAEDYDLKFDDGFVIGEEDKPIVDSFLQHAHALNQTPDEAKANIEWYYREVERQADERQEQDIQAKTDCEVALRTEYGDNYRAEWGNLQNILATIPEDTKNRLLAGRMTDGTPVGSDPEFLKWMINNARQLNSMGRLTGAAGGDAMKTIDDRIKEIDDIMKKDRKRYDKENLAAEKVELLDRKAAMEGKPNE